jgi:hypothetical protein
VRLHSAYLTGDALKAKGYLLPEFYSGATGRSGRFNEDYFFGAYRRMLRFRIAPSGQMAGRIKAVHTSREINLTHANVMHFVALRTIEPQYRPPMCPKSLHVHLDVGRRFSVRIRTGEVEACHGHLLHLD